jgi:hypothetical protein
MLNHHLFCNKLRDSDQLGDALENFIICNSSTGKQDDQHKSQQNGKQTNETALDVLVARTEERPDRTIPSHKIEGRNNQKDN